MLHDIVYHCDCVISFQDRRGKKRLRFSTEESTDPRINRSLALVTAITIRLGKHPAGVSSGRTRPCPAVNLAPAIIWRVRWRPVPSRSRRDATSRRGRWTARRARRHYYVASIPLAFPLGRAPASAIAALSPRPLRWTPLPCLAADNPWLRGMTTCTHTPSWETRNITLCWR